MILYNICTSTYMTIISIIIIIVIIIIRSL